jgi:predicted ArsR family transcriptional regulator
MFGDPTRRRVYLYARERLDGVTAAEVAEFVEIHANVARHHLEKLAAGGYLDVAITAAPGKTGRPSKRYRSTGREIELAEPARRHDLIVTLLGRALSLLTPEQAEQMAEEVGEHYGRELAEQMNPGDGHRSMQYALHAVAEALTAHGFAAHAEARDGELSIVSGACPFGSLSEQHPVICAVDRGMVKAMLNTLAGDDADPELTASRPQGADVCVTTV